MSDKPDFQIPLEPERYELTAPPAYRFEVDRREFFKFLGAGILIVGVLKNAHALQESGEVRLTDESLPKEIGLAASRKTACDGLYRQVESARTPSLGQCVAELHIGERNPNDDGRYAVTPFDMGTFGSRTTPTMSPQLRKVAAALAMC
jgi:isoquinoline 1-oxidoreductase